MVIGLEPSSQGDRFSLCLVIEHKAGSRAQIIDIIGKHGLNMQCIQSRPIKGRPFEYFFFIEFDGNLEDENVQHCLKEIRTICERVKVLGNYTLKED